LQLICGEASSARADGLAGAEPALQFVDVAQNCQGAELLEGADAFTALVTAAAEDADEGHPGGFGGEGIVNVVPQVDGALGRAAIEDLQEALRVGLGPGDIFGGDNAPEICASLAPVEGVVHFIPDAAGENSEVGLFGEAPQGGKAKKPLFAVHIAIAIGAPVDFEELVLDFVVLLLTAERLHPGGGKLPIVVEAREILPLMELLVSDPLAGEMRYRLQHGLVEGFVDIDEYAVYIEDNDFGEFANGSFRPGGYGSPPGLWMGEL